MHPIVWKYVSLDVAMLLVASMVGAQPMATNIELEPAIECWYHDALPEMSARFEPANVERSRLYFRCSLFSDYYFVDLEPTPEGGYRGVGPMAEASCPQVLYYVEAVTRDFASARTPERVADVTAHDECRRSFPAAAVFTGDPDIVIGSTTVGAPPMAPGFKAEGVTRFLSAGGQLTAADGGGGLSSGAVLGVSAGAAGGAALVLASGSEDASESAGAPEMSPEPGSTSPTTTTSVSPTPASPEPAPVRACFDIDPASASIEPGETIRFDARCSEGTNLTYSWDLGDGRRREGAFITPVYRDPGTYTVTLTVTDGSGLRFALRAADSVSHDIEVVEPPPPAAALTPCFTAQPINLGSNCDMMFDASCTQGNIVSYDWILDETNVMGAGPFPDSGVVVFHDWTGYPGCVTTPPWPNISVKLTVTDSGGNVASGSQTVSVQYLLAPDSSGAAIATSATSLLETASHTEATGAIRWNGGRTDSVVAGETFHHQVRGRAGENHVEAFLTSAPGEPGRWRIDFGAAPGFVPGSIRVDSGRIFSKNATSVVFRTSGTIGEMIRIRFRLSP